MQSVNVDAMKAISVTLFALLSRVAAYDPCLLQAEFDTVMCKSYVCMSESAWGEDKCMGFQKKYPKCRCPEWPCSRRCYHDKACPNDDDLPKCVDPTVAPPPTPPPDEEVVEEEQKGEEKEEEQKEEEKEEEQKEEEKKEDAPKKEEGKKEIREMPDDFPGDGDGDGELDGDDYDYGDGEGDDGPWVDPYASENEWDPGAENQGDDDEGQLNFLRKKGFLKKHPGGKPHHHGKKSGHGRKKRNFLMRFLRRHHLGKKLGLIFARGGQTKHHVPASKDHQESQSQAASNES